jgi:hypothetical protein
MSALSEKEMRQLYRSVKKLGLFAADKLEKQETQLRSSRHRTVK